MSIKKALENLSETAQLRPIAIGFYKPMIDRLDKLADGYGQSRSEVVRLLVEDALDRLENEQDDRESKE